MAGLAQGRQFQEFLRVELVSGLLQLLASGLLQLLESALLPLQVHPELVRGFHMHSGRVGSPLHRLGQQFQPQGQRGMVWLLHPHNRGS